MSPGARLTELRNALGIARRIPGLTPRQRARWIAAGAGLALPGRRRSLSVPVRLPDGRTVDFNVGHTTDLAVIHEVLYAGQYAAPGLENPALIVDAGSHIGASVAWFASRYPACRVVGFEASPTTFACLQQNVRGFPNVEVHNIALGAHDGPAAFFEAAAPWESSLRAHGQPGVTVSALTLDGVLGLAGPEPVDLLKVDIEGSEYEVLRACPPRPERVRRIVGELHTWIEDRGFTDREFFALLAAYDVEDDASGADRVFRATARSLRP
jgi:FkbM family methyltransferase